MLHQRFAIKRFPVLLGNVRNPLFADALRFSDASLSLRRLVSSICQLSTRSVISRKAAAWSRMELIRWSRPVGVRLTSTASCGGANPGELPVQLPTRYELAINLKTAKTLA